MYKRKNSASGGSRFKRARGRSLFGGGRIRSSKWTRAKRGLARLSVSRRSARAGFNLNRALSAIAETKLLGVNVLNEGSPAAIQTGAIAYVSPRS